MSSDSPHDVPSPADLARTRLADVLARPALKQAFVTPMFQHIAPRYDQFTRIFSFGMDRRWKEELISWLRQRSSSTRDIADLACGTGDLTFAAAKCFADSGITGIDAASRMIDAARARRADTDDRIVFSVGDLSSLAMPDESIDVVLAGYAYRNVPSLALALQESARVLRRGGSLYVLDFYRPRNALWRVIFLGYLHAAGAVFGWMWHRAPVIYTYIAASIRAYVSADEFSNALSQAGFVVVRTRRHLFGGIALHEARRVR